MRRDIAGSKQIDWILDIGLGEFCVALLVLTTSFMFVVRFIISGRCRCWTEVVILLTYCTAAPCGLRGCKN